MNNNYYSLAFIFCCYLLVFGLRTTRGAPRFQPQEGQYHDGHALFAWEPQTATDVTQQVGPFQLCLACKCCAAAAAGTPPPTCAIMPCCFAIDCQIPGKPFGVCAFVPKTCDCTSCAV
ncbi:hypothetical protein MLD38_026575 [Melastoma candidum]|uniref:Uncharacterized protein n=1 Tax=Melastoma candidum TaxID=119954 RepID=A0ACB9NZ05_9MYRT|nr:hypothetical protein MLD38_026575 [Melastoma candidum]